MADGQLKWAAFRPTLPNDFRARFFIAQMKNRAHTPIMLAPAPQA